MKLRLKINGEKVELDVAPLRHLVDILRNDLGLIGVHEGCSTGECGACTILLNGKPVPSCLIISADVQNAEIFTVEGIARTKKGRQIIESFARSGAVQCGYCTPGFVVTTAALTDSNSKDIENHIEGNLCRCTGYKKILEAVKSCSKNCKGE